jgi:hypothetical protein
MFQYWITKHILVAMMGLVAVTVVLTSGLGLSGVVQAAEVRHQRKAPDAGDYLRPTGKGWGERDLTGMGAARAGKFSPRSSNGIDYHGGPVMLNTVNVYYIWYGSWPSTNDTTKSLLTTFGNSIGGTPYFNINTTYYDATPTNVSGLVTLKAQTADSGSLGNALSDANVQTIVEKALANGALGSPDPNGVYFVLTSEDVNETSGFCTQYCAWHAHGTINGKDIKYGFVGNPARCPSACSAQGTTPNGDLAADAMANLIAHELAEAATDPDLNAWYDRRGYENADKCAWKFGTTSTASNGSKYNVTFGQKNWLLQQNWANASGGYCGLNLK